MGWNADEREVSRAPETDGPRDRRAAAVLRWSLAGLPEMELFESEQQRDAALRMIATEAGNPRGRSWWIGLAILATSMVVAFAALRFASRLVNWPGIVEESIRIAAMFACAALVIRWLHRSGARKELREKLIAFRVPVCRGCGYSLRGQPMASPRCSECGREIDADARAILQPPPKLHHDLDPLIGSREADPAIDEVLADQDRIDPAC